MIQRKPPQPSNTAEVSLVRSSAAEYLTFVAASGQGGVEAIYADESIWLTQKMLAQLYDVNVRTVNEHLKKIFTDSELQEDSVIRKFRITATDGKNYNTQHYKQTSCTGPSMARRRPSWSTTEPMPARVKVVVASFMLPAVVYPPLANGL